MKTPLRIATLLAIGAILAVSATAQTARFIGAEISIRSVAADVYGIAVDSYGDVFITCTTSNQVLKEEPYNGGYVESTIGSGLNSPYAVAVDKSGAVYIADGGNQRVLKETPHNRGYIQSTVASGFDSSTGVAVDSAGNVYIADGPAGKVYKEKLVGNIYESSTVQTGLSSPYGLAVDAGGDIFIADSGDNRVWKETPSGSGYTRIAIGSGLNYPSGVGVDLSGNVYIADSGNERVLKETPSGAGYTQSTVSTVTSMAPPSNVGGPDDVAVDAAGNIYIALDPGTGGYAGDVLKELPSGANFGTVSVGATSIPISLKFVFETGGTLGSVAVTTQGAPSGDFVSAISNSCEGMISYVAGQTCTINLTFKPQLAGTRTGAASLTNGASETIATGYVYGTGEASQVNFLPGTQTTVPYLTAGQASIYGVAVDGSGNVYVADADNNLVRKETWSGSNYIESVVGTGLNSPTGLAVDGSGALYIADTQNSRVLKETPSAVGYYQTTIGSGLDQPYGVAVDGNGNVYIADTVHKRVLKETLSGGAYTQSTLPASGLSGPFGVAVDGAGNVYIADTGNKRVLMLTYSAGTYTQTVMDGSVDVPYGVAVDGFGNVFIADFGQKSVFRESPSPSGYVGSALYLPSLLNPYAVTVDGGGNLYVADIGTNELYKEDYADAPYLTFDQTLIGSTSADSPKIVTVENIGNETLDFPIPLSGDNPNLSTTSFTLNDNVGLGCTVLTPSSETVATLGQNDGCLLAISFSPQAAGSLFGTLAVTDNALNDIDVAGQILGLLGDGVLDATVVEWATPQPIVYGTALSATQLNASAGSGATTLPGTFVYTPPAGTVLQAGSSPLKAAFTPTNSAKYAKSNGQVTQVVQKAQLTITANNLGKTYGAANPTLTYIVTGFVNGDTAATALTGAPNISTTATAASAPGAYPITMAAGTLAAKNYTFQFAAGTLTVSKALLTITANNASVVYDKALPAFTYTPTGFVNGDTKSVLTGTPTEGTTAIVGSLPGAYPINIARGTLAAANYSFVFAAGTLTVTPLGVTATPIFTPPGGAYSVAQTVTATDATPGAIMYYTTNGTTPTVNSTKVEAAFHVGTSETLKVIAIAPGYTQSATATAVYTIN
jgi:streptogramin lyase